METKSKARLALIGCGGIGSYHLGHFLGFTDIIDMVGFCDLIPERAQAFSEKAGCGAVYTDYKKMLDETNPDMVFVCIPPYCHGEVEYELIKRKIHFFVEKPLSLDIEQAKDILLKSEAAGIVTASGFQCRYSNLVEPNIEYIKANKIFFVSCERMGGIPMVEWWRNKELSGGQAVEQTIHQFDIIRYVFGEPDTVFSMNTTGLIDNPPEGYKTDDLSVTCVKFKNGAVGTISTGCYVEGGDAYDSKVVFSSSKSRAELKILGTLKIFGETAVKKDAEDKGEGGFVVKGDGGIGAGSGNSTVYKQVGDAGILCDLTFIEAAIKGDPTLVRSPYRDALRSLAFTLACNQSMESGLPVRIDDLLKGI
ncbi:MAG: Gfo/Idh/MocA family oxidoreductase [Clostridia bacterium]|nr:Gfo/Idh/MocA family oxidoreductase [Clostridia bacterium]